MKTAKITSIGMKNETENETSYNFSIKPENDFDVIFVIDVVSLSDAVIVTIYKAQDLEISHKQKEFNNEDDATDYVFKYIKSQKRIYKVAA